MTKPEDATRSRVTLDEFYNYKVFPNQRPHEERARSKKWQEKMLRPQNDHYEVKSVRCGCDIVNPLNPLHIYREGDKIKTDGHSRAEFFHIVCKEIGREDLIPSHLNDTHHDVYDWDDLQDAFNVYDNNQSVFRGSDKFFGAARINKLTFKNFNAVQSIASLEYAASSCYPNQYVKGKTSTNQEANRMMKDVGDGFVWLDSVISDPNFGNQIPLTPMLKCAYVMACMMYSDNQKALDLLKQFVLDVSTKSINTRVKDIDSCSFFITKWQEIVFKQHASAYCSALNRSNLSSNTLAFTLKMIDDFIKGETRSKMPNSTTIGNYLKTWQNRFNLETTSLMEAFDRQPVD
tara:strand:+ start:52 stop:1092 length:1041 start_codon:yes stop_codon:yes gene_type:complete